MNKDIEQIASSASMDLIAKAKSLKASGVDVIGLAGGEPDFDTPKAIKVLLNNLVTKRCKAL